MSTRPTRVYRLLAAPLADDRGVVHRWARMNRPEWPFTGPVLPAPLRRAVAASFRAEQERRVGKVGFCWQMAAMVAPPVIAAQIVGLVAAQALDAGRGAGAVVIVAAVFLGSGTVVFVALTPALDRVMRRMWGASIRHAFLASGRCVACAYDLAGAPVQPDGCTVCPECGAAWRVGGGGE